MTPFQVVGIMLCLVFAAWSVRRWRLGPRPRVLSLFGAVLGLVGAIAIRTPELTTQLAQSLGIARGADLLTYLVALAFLGSWFYFYQRIRSLSSAVTALVREAALRNPRVPPAEDAGVQAGVTPPDGTRGHLPHGDAEDQP